MTGPAILFAVIAGVQGYQCENTTARLGFFHVYDGPLEVLKVPVLARGGVKAEIPKALRVRFPDFRQDAGLKCELVFHIPVN